MKIIFLTDDFPPQSFGGAGIVAYNLARGLRDKGHEVFIVTTVQNKSDARKEERENLTIFRIFSSYQIRWQAYLSLYNPRVISEIRQIIKDIQPDIIHAHNIHQHLSYYCLKVAKQYTKGVFLTAHDTMLFSYGKLIPRNGKDIYRIGVLENIRQARKRYNPLRNKIIRNYLKYVDKIFAVSNPLKDLLEKNGFKNIEVIQNGIDVDDWRVDNEKTEEFKNKYNLKNKKVIIFAARLIEAKGGDQLIQSLALVNKNFPQFILLVVGKEWAYTEKMKNMAKELSIGGKIIFTGYLSTEELKIAYHAADLSVFPSICFETFGMSNLEAMACKKPVVSSYFGGPKEVVLDGETGYLVNPHNIDLMAGRITNLLKTPKRAERFGEEGYKRARENFSIKQQVEKTLKWYKNFYENITC